MTAPWLHIVGIGEEGLDGLLPATRAVVEAAEVIIGGDRHHKLSSPVTAERVAWPSPFDALIDQLRGYRGRRVVVLATGDPLWYSVGARIGRAIDPTEITYHPQLSAFQHAAARMGWSMADVTQLTVHGRPPEQVIPHIQPEQRLLILTTGAETPAMIAQFLCERGYGPSRMTVLAAMGGANEARFHGVAETWNQEVPAFNTMAVECIAGPDAQIFATVPGLPDDAFQGDGTMTKQEVRAITLAKLMPMREALLWDLGCGCGSVSIEWMRAAPEAMAIGIEPREDRRGYAAANALALGTPRLQLRAGTAEEHLVDLPSPDAVFVGGGLSMAVLERAFAALKPHGRLVANAVTLESEAILLQAAKVLGGDLMRLQVARAEPVGQMTGWRAAMPVTQFSVRKGG
ncbi:precorrin-6y C5,15-methyltransferase (decarboxylating) subunit CbiE [Shimia ponticola]|uniref:precorrin-6y C5,15-methyltransferase (decarboxylating) subunit CbiE n=1 Tax=Shimia ponticola TaxID=2582893 RepID=UPI0011BE507A|nr:precorrin-6y C5,15-methyltransferase (decarboxylating) subunit CbiE [Shimia ponticola]